MLDIDVIYLLCGYWNYRFLSDDLYSAEIISSLIMLKRGWREEEKRIFFIKLLLVAFIALHIAVYQATLLMIISSF